MNDEFFKDRARTIRALADKADPFTRIRLLELADRYDRRPGSPTPIPAVKLKPVSPNTAAGIVEEILSIPEGSLSERVGHRTDGHLPPATTRLLSDVIRGRSEK